ncbi:hypothetical protein KP509_29G013400 [Ceratopteris richardii]|uniref:Uncharacterized protein n=1 Tax=Ceratopteris richardii TaxID=49495 RepID=A0A8T2R3M0_CERRI|nr:hypothetical protein KP509_30G056200 [Ceratopteris richardii]KAH7291355.1 hypothetical protein KP509_29G013400 [Ceratopteris richardii]
MSYGSCNLWWLILSVSAASCNIQDLRRISQYLTQVFPFRHGGGMGACRRSCKWWRGL